MKHLILTFLALLSINLNGYASIQVDGICYDLNSLFGSNGDYIGEEAIVVRNDIDEGGYSGDITIPATIQYYDAYEKKTFTYNVTEINDRAFSGNEKITGITILAPVKKVDLSNCKGLETLVLPNSVEDFNCRECSSLTSIHIPTSMRILDFTNLQGCSSITSLEIPNNITATRETFYGMENLKKVTIEDGNTILETNGIFFCEDWKSLEYLYLGRDIISQVKSNSLKTLEIGPNVTELLQGMFKNCSALENVIIHGETTIGNNAFMGCTTLSKVNGLENVTNIGNEAFSGCTSLTSISLSPKITLLGNSIFEGCTQITSVSLPNSLTWLGDNSFSGCTSLTSISFSPNITTLGNYSFSNCTALTTISVPNSVSWFGDGVFSGCTGLTNVKLSDNLKVIPSHAFYGCTNLQSIEIPEGVERIEKQAFGSGINNPNGSQLAYVKLPSTLKYVGPAAFADCYKLQELHFEGQLSDWVKITFNHFLANSDGDGGSYYPEDTNPISYAREFFVRNNFPVTDIYISEDMDSISPRAFYRYRGTINSVTIDDGIKELKIGSNAFGLRNAVGTLTIGKNIKSIAGSLPAASKVIFSGSMKDWCNLKLLKSPVNGKLYVGGKEVTGKLELPEGITTIPSYHFSNLGVTTITIPSTVISIEDGALSGCWKLEEVTLPNKLTNIGNSAFENCSALKSITRVGTTTRSASYDAEEALSIGKSAFAYCSELADINLGNIDHVGESAFYWTKWLDNQPDGLLTIGNTIYGYKGEEKLKNTDFKVADNIKYICDNALSNQNITSITFPSSLQYIGSSAFSGNSITKVTIPTSVTEIGKEAFAGNPLTELTIEDGESPLIIPQGGYRLFGIELHKLKLGRNLSTPVCASFMYLPLEEITFGKYVKEIPCIFYDNYRLKQITCLSTEAPTLQENYRYDGMTYNVFDDDILRKCTLYVPEESIEKYKTAEVWKNFYNITGSTTVIRGIEMSEQDIRPTKYFDMEGRIVMHPQKGHIYVTNKGKKIIF